MEEFPAAGPRVGRPSGLRSAVVAVPGAGGWDIAVVCRMLDRAGAIGVVEQSHALAEVFDMANVLVWNEDNHLAVSEAGDMLQPCTVPLGCGLTYMTRKMVHDHGGAMIHHVITPAHRMYVCDAARTANHPLPPPTFLGPAVDDIYNETSPTVDIRVVDNSHTVPLCTYDQQTGHMTRVRLIDRFNENTEGRREFLVSLPSSRPRFMVKPNEWHCHFMHVVTNDFADGLVLSMTKYVWLQRIEGEEWGWERSGQVYLDVADILRKHEGATFANYANAVIQVANVSSGGYGYGNLHVDCVQGFLVHRITMDYNLMKVKSVAGAVVKSPGYGRFPSRPVVWAQIALREQHQGVSDLIVIGSWRHRGESHSHLWARRINADFLVPRRVNEIVLFDKLEGEDYTSVSGWSPMASMSAITSRDALNEFQGKHMSNEGPRLGEIEWMLFRAPAAGKNRVFVKHRAPARRTGHYGPYIRNEVHCDM